MEVTQQEFQSFKTELAEYFKEINRKMDRLLDPESGVFAKIQQVNAKADKAHSRIDAIDASHTKVKEIVYGIGDGVGVREDIRELKEHRTNTVKILSRIGWTIVTPIGAGIGYLIWTALVG